MSLFDQLPLRDDVLAALHAQPATDPEVQVIAQRLAETWTESASKCNNSGWALVHESGRTVAIYEKGLRLAQAACRLQPDERTFLNTLGVAQYRLGRTDAALATLTRSNDLNQDKEPADLAFLAMTFHRLGKYTEARAKLERLRDVMRLGDSNKRQAPENLAFLAEAEAVVLSDSIFPADPFAR